MLEERDRTSAQHQSHPHLVVLVLVLVLVLGPVPALVPTTILVVVMAVGTRLHRKLVDGLLVLS